MSPKYQVICTDGETRHSAPFASLSAALRWTAEGHNCPKGTLHNLVVRGVSGEEFRKIDCTNARARGASCLDTIELEPVH